MDDIDLHRWTEVRKVTTDAEVRHWRWARMATDIALGVVGGLAWLIMIYILMILAEATSGY